MSAARRKRDAYDVEQLRAREFPWAARGDVIYLNNAATGPLPARTVRALERVNALRAEPWRLSVDDETGICTRARSLLARLIGAEPSEIALTGNTSAGINLASRALPLPPGSVVVSPDREFPANVYPWMAMESAGVRLERLPCTPEGWPDEAALLRALARPEVRAVAVSWVGFATGYRVDLARLGRACRERGAYLVVDAIQGLGALELDVSSTPVDILACGGQKWLLSPWGTGFVYVRRALVEAMEPTAVGWRAMRGADDVTSLVAYDFTFRDDARRFEVMTLPYQDIAGMVASLELLHELGPRAVASHVGAVATTAVAWALGRRDVRLCTPADPARRAGIVALVPRDLWVASRRLERAGVIHAVREGAIRLAPHAYNTEQEMTRALEVLGARP